MRPVDLALTRWAVSRLDGFLVPAASLSAWQGGAFLWSTNRLMPAQTARTYSEHLLGRFRDICEDLELAVSLCDGVVHAQGGAALAEAFVEVEPERPHLRAAHGALRPPRH